MSKCEHGLTSAECYVCASPKYGKYDDATRCPNCDNLRLELGAERQSVRAYRILRVAVEAMMAPLGYHGAISARDDRVQSVMDALNQIDDIENGGKPVCWSAILESLRDKDKGGPT